MTALRDFTTKARRVRGVEARPSQFGTHPPAWWLGGREIAHAHQGKVEVRLTRRVMARMRDTLERDARIDYRRPGSDWVRLQLRTGADVDQALRLLRIAVRANRL